MKKRLFKRITTAAIAGVTVVAGLSGIFAHKTQAATTSQINTYIKKASLNQKIGQMYIARTPQKLGQAEQDAYKYNLGGYIMYDGDMQNYTQKQFKSKIDNYQKNAQLPLLIGIDQEGGSVSRLTHSGLVKENGDQFKFPRDQYENAEANKKGSGMDAVLQYATDTATLLHDLGINWNYAPDADYSDNPYSFIYQRGFGGLKGKKSYQAEANYIKQVVPAWQHDNLVAATLKHFPGYGDATDTHTDFAHVNTAKSTIMKTDVLPFKAGIKAGVDSVMVTHVIYDKIDPVYPASLSKKVINLLRKDCKFNGVIVTDALEMGAIQNFAKTHGNESVDVLAVKAGNDMIMTDDYAKGIPAIAKAVKKGEISKSQIDKSVKRILTMKNKLGLLSASDLQVKKANKKTFKLDEISYTKKNTAIISGLAAKNSKLTLTNTDTKKTTTFKANKKGQFKVTLPLKSSTQNFILTGKNYLDTNIHLNSGVKSTVKKKLNLKPLKYDKKGKYATVSGQVDDEGAEGSLTIAFKDSKTKMTLTTTVVGKDGKFSAKLPLKKSKQTVNVSAQNDSDYVTQNIVIRAK